MSLSVQLEGFYITMKCYIHFHADVGAELNFMHFSANDDDRDVVLKSP